jgi:hypothetical protein
VAAVSTRKINVIETSVIKSGSSDSGKAWTLYDVTATSVEGVPIEEKLKSFEKLDGEVEVEIERQEHEKYGVSYMLTKAGGGGGGGGGGSKSAGARLGPKVDELRGRVERLEGMVDAMNSTLLGLQSLVAQVAKEPDSRAYGQTPEPEPERLGHNAAFGDPDDIPF